MAAAQRIPYPQINLEIPELRLLHLSPASQYDDDIQCHLTVSLIHDPIRYDALSYTWGNPYDTLLISIGGYAFNITKNLDAALRQLRLSKTIRILWVDAICINQADLQEKSLQVPRMHEIYSGADKVIVWLGESSDLSDIALDLIQNAAAVTRKETGVKLDKVFDPSTTPPSDTEQVLWQKAVDEGWKSLTLLFSRPWWSRVWVVQEVVFSQSCIVLCGSRAIDWQDFTDSWDTIREISQKLRVLGASSLVRMRIIPYVNLFRQITQRRPTSGIEQMAREQVMIHYLNALRDLEATDPRDHVFGSLGMAYPSGSIGLFPLLETENTIDYESGLFAIWKADYSKDAAQVFAGVTKFIIIIHGDLRVLSLVESSMDEKDDPDTFTEIELNQLSLSDRAYIARVDGKYARIRTSMEQRTDQDDASLLTKLDGRKRVMIPRLPSWVPNWAQVRLSNPVPGDYDMPGDQEHGIHPYQASGTLKADYTVGQTSNGIVFQLRTKGVAVGTVSRVGGDFYGHERNPILINDDMFMEAVGIVDSLESLYIIPPDQSLQEALVRTFAGDRSVSGTIIQGPDYDILNRSIQRFIIGKRFIIIDGQLGFGPRATRIGDEVFIIPGCHVPVVLRRKSLVTVCSEHNHVKECTLSGCFTRARNHVLEEWFQVIGGACKFISYTAV